MPGFVQNAIVSANDAAVQTEGVVIEAGKAAWIAIADDLSCTVSYEAQADEAIPEYVEMFTVHAYVPLAWETVNLWAWSAPDGTNAYAAWPGEAMAEEDGWYTVQAPGWINSVIINGNAGSVQTADLSVESGVDVWVVVTDAENASVTYEAP